MRKLYNLKNWYSLQDAASRLTITLGEDISVNDMLQMTVEGHLPLSWYMRHVSARSVAPYTKIWNWDTHFNSVPEKFGLKHECNPGVWKVMLCLEPLSEEVQYLDGIHRLGLEICGAMKDWVLSLITNTGGELISLDGYLVRDSKDGLWQIMERFSRTEREENRKAAKLPPSAVDYSKSINHSDNFYPSGGCPDEADLGFTRDDLEKFEALVTTAASLQLTQENPLKTRERATALKLVVGTATAWYGYNPRAARSTTISDIVKDLERVGIEVSEDTAGRWLREGTEYLPQELEKV